MNLANKSIGLLKIVLSLTWIALALLVLVSGLRWISVLETRAAQVLEVAAENINLVEFLMNEIVEVMEKVDSTLSTVERSLIDGGFILRDTRPVVEKTSQLMIEEVPQALEDMQGSMPAVIQAARTIEQTLNLLSGFKFTIPIPLAADLQFDLGVDYSPEVSLEESLANLNGALERIPGQMRQMEGDFIGADISVTVMSENLLDIAHDLDRLREQLVDINPAIEAMAASLERMRDSLAATRESVPALLKTARSALTLLAILFLLSQVPPLYSGVRMLVEKAGAVEGVIVQVQGSGDDRAVSQPGEESET